MCDEQPCSQRAITHLPLAQQSLGAGEQLAKGKNMASFKAKNVNKVVFSLFLQCFVLCSLKKHRVVLWFSIPITACINNRPSSIKKFVVRADDPVHTVTTTEFLD